MILDQRSRVKLEGVDNRLVRVVLRAAEITPVDFIVIEGLRDEKRQAILVKSGASQTMKSKHLVGRAVDLAALVDGEVRWDWPLYHKLAGAMKQAAKELNIPLVWGGDWKKFKDGPHFELG